MDSKPQASVVPNPEEIVDEVDLEQLALAGAERVPRARRYRIRIDREHFVVHVPHMTGAEILKLAGHTPQTHELYEKKRRHEPVQIAPNQTVDFTKPGIERFQTIPIDPTDGLAPRRQFDLTREDVESLEDRGLSHETLVVEGVHWVLIHEYPVPAGYNHARATAACRLSTTYPDTEIDMVYFYPHLARQDGKGINNLTMVEKPLDGNKFQQWSRHRTPQNKWRPGIDHLGTHLLMVDDWLAREFR